MSCLLVFPAELVISFNDTEFPDRERKMGGLNWDWLGSDHLSFFLLVAIHKD